MDELMEHEAGEGEEVQPSQHLWQAFAVARQPATAAHPGETALHHPAFGQQDEAAFGLGRLDDDQLDAVRGGAGRGIGTGVALVDIGDLDVFAGHGLHLRRQRLRPGSARLRWLG